jgi:hypothetical protein
MGLKLKRKNTLESEMKTTLIFFLVLMTHQIFSQKLHAKLISSVKRSKLDPIPEYFDRYINLVNDVSLQEAFDKSVEQLDHLDLRKFEAIGEKVYSPGKWTVKDILQHIIDAERILNYRVLRFARNDTTAAPNFDQDETAENVKTTNRSLNEMMAELKAVRKSTTYLFYSFDDTILQRQGFNWKYKVSVLAMGFMIIGHQRHHLKVIEERYFPLIK